jgi:hypothetical protein
MAQEEVMGPVSVWHCLTWSVVVALSLAFIPPMALIIRKLGFSWPQAVMWAVLVATPGVGLVAIWVLALVEWPHWRHSAAQANA